METNIEISQISRNYKENNKNDDNVKSNYRTTIINYSHFTVNESTIAYKIKKIPYYSNFFSILVGYESLNISQLNEDTIERLRNIDEVKYYLFKYNDKNSIDFIDYLYAFTTIKELILGTINSFEHILYGLHILNENGICFFNISPKNIVFLDNYREKPVLSNFRMGLRLDKLGYEYFSHILNKLGDFTYLPIEVHVLYYFVKHRMVTISYSFIEDFCDKFIEKMNILRLFSDSYKQSYRDNCVEVLKKYINRPRQEIIEDIMERNDKWDVYGISMLFLQIFGCISRVFSLKGTFISKITIELSKNLHPDSDRRMTLERTLNEFNRLLNEQEDWKFINKLDNNKLDQLFDEFSK